MKSKIITTTTVTFKNIKKIEKDQFKKFEYK